MTLPQDPLHVYVWTAFIAGWMSSAGAIFLKQSLDRGCSPWSANLFSNLALGMICAPLWFFVEPAAMSQSWTLAIYAGFAFFIAQIVVIIAVARTAPSIATPLIGTKVLWVVLLSADLFGRVLSSRWWWAAGLVSLGIFLIVGIQPIHGSKLRDCCIGGCFAIVAAIAFALSDVLLAHAAQHVGTLGAVAIAYSEVGLLALVIYPGIFGKKIWFVSAQQGGNWLALGIGLFTLEAIILRLAIAKSENASFINMIYSTRCMWGVLLTWWLARYLNLPESKTKSSTMMLRIVGAVLLTSAILIVLV